MKNNRILPLHIIPMKHRCPTQGRFRALSILPAAFLLLPLSGCDLQGAAGLDATDRKFAALYCEYLVRSGADDPAGNEQAASLGSAELDSLFARHGIDQRTFDARLSTYARNPGRWREVLALVRKNIRSRP